MNVQNLPRAGEMLFLANKEVLVINVYALFQLIKIRYINEPNEFYVDACALTLVPNFTKSLSLGLFRGNRSEQNPILYW